MAEGPNKYIENEMKEKRKKKNTVFLICIFEALIKPWQRQGLLPHENRGEISDDRKNRLKLVKV